VRRPLRILRGEVRIATLRVDRPRVNLDYLPALGGDSEAERGGFPRIAIDDLVIHRGSFIRDGRFVAQEVDARLGLDSKPERVQIELRDAQAVLGADTLRVTRSSGAATWEGDSLQVDLLQVTTGSSAIAARGAYALAERRILATSEWNPLAAADVARFVKLPIQAGALTGPVSMHWNNGRLQVEGNLRPRGSRSGRCRLLWVQTAMDHGGMPPGASMDSNSKSKANPRRSRARHGPPGRGRRAAAAGSRGLARASADGCGIGDDAAATTRPHRGRCAASQVRGVRVSVRTLPRRLGKEWRIDNAASKPHSAVPPVGTVSEQALALDFGRNRRSGRRRARGWNDGAKWRCNRARAHLREPGGAVDRS
jgi:hypothetical protein